MVLRKEYLSDHVKNIYHMVLRKEYLSYRIT